MARALGIELPIGSESLKNGELRGQRGCETLGLAYRILEWWVGGWVGG